MSDRNKLSPIRLIIGGLLLILVLVFGFFLLLSRQNATLANEVKIKSDDTKKGIAVKIAKVTTAAPSRDLVLIGEARPFLTATLYAKTSGYVSKMLVDKGDHVKQGQLLATIISPETDQALQAAQSDLENKQKIFYRDTSLVRKQYISVEEKEAAETAVHMSESSVNSLKEQQQYKNITAPFDGTITARYADPGALVQNAVNSQTSALPLVTVSQLNKMRIYVYVEQKDADYVKPGYPVTITLAEKPGLVLRDKVSRRAGELDPKTRMELVEIDRSNAKMDIVPGSFVQVHIEGPEVRHLQIPSDALIIRGNKYFVAVVDSASTLHFKEVQVGDNTGVHVLVLDGLSENQVIALNVGDHITEGEKVRTSE
jgi:membrane fusion protein, multidrug efflux system